MTSSSRIRTLSVLGISILAMNQIGAAPIDPNNILVSVRHSIREFTPAGALVQIIPLNYGGREYPGVPPNPLREDPADIAVDQYAVDPRTVHVDFSQARCLTTARALQ